MRLTKWRIKPEYDNKGVVIVSKNGQLPVDEKVLTDALIDGLSDKTKAKFFELVPAPKPAALKPETKDGNSK